MAASPPPGPKEAQADCCDALKKFVPRVLAVMVAQHCRLHRRLKAIPWLTLFYFSI